MFPFRNELNMLSFPTLVPLMDVLLVPNALRVQLSPR